MSSYSPPKRPRLSLQIKALSTGPSIRTSRTLAAVVNPRSPTSFNTLSNVYSTAIDRSASTPAPVTAEPVTAINMTAKSLPQLPRLQMPGQSGLDHSAHTPYVTTQFPETPLTARPMSPAVAKDVAFPSTMMTATPPLSAGPIDQTSAQPQVFCFSPDDVRRHSQSDGNTGNASFLIRSEEGCPVDGDADTAITDSCSESSFTGSETGVDTPFPSNLHSSPPHSQSTTGAAATANGRVIVPAISMPRRPAPYVHPRTLHSILRNSPLPPFTALSPTSARRQSQRLIEKASRRVMYNSPLTQTITTNLYTKSHIDLLCEEASPFSSPFSSPMTSTPTGNDADTVLDLTLAYTGNEIRDGGTTPGPFEEMRRRMAGLGTSSASTSTATTPISPGGIRKRKQPRRDKKRRWVWTLGHDEEEEATLSGAMIALKAAQMAEAAALSTATPTTSQADALATPSEADADADLKTPLALQTTAFAHSLNPVSVVANASNEDVDMQDSDACTMPVTGDAASAAAEADKVVVPSGPSKPKDARKRKSTPTPYATDSEGESGCDGDGDDFGLDGSTFDDIDHNQAHAADTDMDMQTPTTILGNQLQGAWFRAAAATAGRARTAPWDLSG
ncbi:hypothetical protein HMPREF1624_08689 [Sporothrix schenckii ATCC 58251]|uniref:Glucan 1, 4-alpha-glucosidase n=1 Tax=Sporothrix schenckii (strain ATCC 58251 / de Perez 2211183) TaxID=1391915 RepID=U7PHI1_SPOS1|nr:hypothetical protein HMPREF1624_08689 [Sporothrix schenckii ATCC 58251]